jgi:hypothetical protein
MRIDAFKRVTTATPMKAIEGGAYLCSQLLHALSRKPQE